MELSLANKMGDIGSLVAGAGRPTGPAKELLTGCNDIATIMLRILIIIMILIVPFISINETKN